MSAVTLPKPSDLTETQRDLLFPIADEFSNLILSMCTEMTKETNLGVDLLKLKTLLAALQTATNLKRHVISFYGFAYACRKHLEEMDGMSAENAFAPRCAAAIRFITEVLPTVPILGHVGITPQHFEAYSDRLKEVICESLYETAVLIDEAFEALTNLETASVIDGSSASQSLTLEQEVARAQTVLSHPNGQALLTDLAMRIQASGRTDLLMQLVSHLQPQPQPTAQSGLTLSSIQSQLPPQLAGFINSNPKIASIVDGLGDLSQLMEAGKEAAAALPKDFDIRTATPEQRGLFVQLLRPLLSKLVDPPDAPLRKTLDQLLGGGLGFVPTSSWIISALRKKLPAFLTLFGADESDGVWSLLDTVTVCVEKVLRKHGMPTITVDNLSDVLCSLVETFLADNDMGAVWETCLTSQVLMHYIGKHIGMDLSAAAKDPFA